MAGIYHKVGYFNFDVISHPFPDSSVHSALGYNIYSIYLHINYSFYSYSFINFTTNKVAITEVDFLLRAQVIDRKQISRD